MTERLDPERPLWAIDLLGPLAGGGRRSCAASITLWLTAGLRSGS